MRKNIDIRGIFGVFVQMAGMDIGKEEWRVLCLLIGQTGIIQGKKIKKNIRDIARYTRMTRSNAKRAIKGLKDKGLIEETGIYISLFANPNRKDVEGGLALSPDLYYLKMLASVKGIDLSEGLALSPLLDNELDYGFFDRFFANTGENNTLSRLTTSPPSDSSTPYIDNIYIGKNSDELLPSQTDPASRSFPKASKQSDPEKSPDENPPKKKGMTMEMIDEMRLSKVLKIGNVTYAIVQAFMELGDEMTMKRIDHIQKFVLDIIRVFELMEEGDEKPGATAWCNQQVLAWKTYYSASKRNLSPEDFISSLYTFFNNAKRFK